MVLQVLPVHHPGHHPLGQVGGKRVLGDKHAGCIANKGLPAWLASKAHDRARDRLDGIGRRHRLGGPPGVVRGVLKEGGVDGSRKNHRDLDLGLIQILLP